jgi:Mg2+/Co2+ transporter CorB
MNENLFKIWKTQLILWKDSENSLPILRYYMKLHTVYEKFLFNKSNSVKINDDLYFILGKFK